MAGKLLGTVKATSNGTQTLAINDLPQTYSHLEVVIHGVYPSTYYTSMVVRVNNDSGTNMYSEHAIKSVTTNAGNFSGANLSTYWGYDSFALGSTGTTWKFWLPDYTSTTRHKSMIGQGGVESDSSSWYYIGAVVGGLYLNTSTAISSISVNTNMAAGTTLTVFGWL